MSTSIASSPTLRCASPNATSSTATGRDFSPSRPAAKNSSRHAVDPPRRLPRLARKQIKRRAIAPSRITTPSLRRAILDILHTDLRDPRHPDLPA